MKRFWFYTLTYLVAYCTAIQILMAQISGIQNKERILTLTNWRGADDFSSTPEILDSVSKAGLRVLLASAISAPAIQPTELSWIFQHSGSSITPLRDSTPAHRILTIRSVQLAYQRTNSNDIKRTMILSLRPYQQPDVVIRYCDTLSAGRALALQTTTYPFFHAPMPPPQESFIEKITEPVLIVGGAVASLLLFFFIRTQ
jgi:hypothetical protein